MIGKDGKTAVATLVERTSRFLILVPLTGRDSLTVGEAIIAATGGLPAQIRRSLTWDCGAEMARHATITATGLPVYFAHPHSPWERGSNENLNRIVRAPANDELLAVRHAPSTDEDATDRPFAHAASVRTEEARVNNLNRLRPRDEHDCDRSAAGGRQFDHVRRRKRRHGHLLTASTIATPERTKCGT